MRQNLKETSRFLKGTFVLRQRLIAIVLSICMILMSGPVQASEIPSASPVGESRPEVGAPIEISAELGTIEEVWKAPNTPFPEKTMIYIQDAHDSLEAQENIARIINDLVENYGVKTVFEEGYEGKVPTDEFFASIKDPEIKETVSYFLMDQLRLGGAEYAHVNRFYKGGRHPSSTVGRQPPHDFELIGADSLKLHQQNIEGYQATARHQQETASDLKEMQTAIRGLANQSFSNTLKEWMKLKERLDSKELDLLDYLKRTQQLFLKGIGLEEFQNRYPHIALLLAADKTRSSKLLKKLKTEVDSKALFLEINRLEDDYAAQQLGQGQHLALMTRDRQIFDDYKLLQLLGRLNRIEVTEEEYDAVAARLQNMDTLKIAEFIAAQTHKAVVLPKRWERNIQAAISFYETARKRDGAIEAVFKKAEGAKTTDDGRGTRDGKSGPMGEGREKKAAGRSRGLKGGNPNAERSTLDASVLVFGGFHKEKIKQILRQQGFSYYIVTPKITHISSRHQDYYKRLMSVGYHPFEAALGLVATALSPERVLTVGGAAQYDPKFALQPIVALAEQARARGLVFDSRLAARQLNDPSWSEQPREPSPRGKRIGGRLKAETAPDHLLRSEVRQGSMSNQVGGEDRTTEISPANGSADKDRWAGVFVRDDLLVLPTVFFEAAHLVYKGIDENSISWRKWGAETADRETVSRWIDSLDRDWVDGFLQKEEAWGAAHYPIAPENLMEDMSSSLIPQAAEKLRQMFPDEYSSPWSLRFFKYLRSDTQSIPRINQVLQKKMVVRLPVNQLIDEEGHMLKGARISQHLLHVLHHERFHIKAHQHPQNKILKNIFEKIYPFPEGTEAAAWAASLERSYPKLSWDEAFDHLFYYFGEEGETLEDLEKEAKEKYTAVREDVEAMMSWYPGGNSAIEALYEINEQALAEAKADLAALNRDGEIAKSFGLRSEMREKIGGSKVIAQSQAKIDSKDLVRSEVRNRKKNSKPNLERRRSERLKKEKQKRLRDPDLNPSAPEFDLARWFNKVWRSEVGKVHDLSVYDGTGADLYKFVERVVGPLAPEFDIRGMIGPDEPLEFYHVEQFESEFSRQVLHPRGFVLSTTHTGFELVPIVSQTSEKSEAGRDIPVIDIQADITEFVAGASKDYILKAHDEPFDERLGRNVAEKQRRWQSFKGGTLKYKPEAKPEIIVLLRDWFLLHVYGPSTFPEVRRNIDREILAEEKSHSDALDYAARLHGRYMVRSDPYDNFIRTIILLQHDDRLRLEKIFEATIKRLDSLQPLSQEEIDSLEGVIEAAAYFELEGNLRAIRSSAHPLNIVIDALEGLHKDRAGHKLKAKSRRRYELLLEVIGEKLLGRATSEVDIWERYFEQIIEDAYAKGAAESLEQFMRLSEAVRQIAQNALETMFSSLTDRERWVEAVRNLYPQVVNLLEPFGNKFDQEFVAMAFMDASIYPREDFRNMIVNYIQGSEVPENVIQDLVQIFIDAVPRSEVRGGPSAGSLRMTSAARAFLEEQRMIPTEQLRERLEGQTVKTMIDQLADTLMARNDQELLLDVGYIAEQFYFGEGENMRDPVPIGNIPRLVSSSQKSERGHGIARLILAVLQKETVASVYQHFRQRRQTLQAASALGLSGNQVAALLVSGAVAPNFDPWLSPTTLNAQNLLDAYTRVLPLAGGPEIHQLTDLDQRYRLASDVIDPLLVIKDEAGRAVSLVDDFISGDSDGATLSSYGAIYQNVGLTEVLTRIYQKGGLSGYREGLHLLAKRYEKKDPAMAQRLHATIDSNLDEERMAYNGADDNKGWVVVKQVSEGEKGEDLRKWKPMNMILDEIEARWPGLVGLHRSQVDWEIMAPLRDADPRAPAGSFFHGLMQRASKAMNLTVTQWKTEARLEEKNKRAQAEEEQLDHRRREKQHRLLRMYTSVIPGSPVRWTLMQVLERLLKSSNEKLERLAYIEYPDGTGKVNIFEAAGKSNGEVIDWAEKIIFHHHRNAWMRVSFDDTPREVVWTPRKIFQALDETTLELIHEWRPEMSPRDAYRLRSDGTVLLWKYPMDNNLENFDFARGEIKKRGRSRYFMKNRGLEDLMQAAADKKGHPIETLEILSGRVQLGYGPFRMRVVRIYDEFLTEVLAGRDPLPRLKEIGVTRVISDAENKHYLFELDPLRNYSIRQGDLGASIYQMIREVKWLDSAPASIKVFRSGSGDGLFKDKFLFEASPTQFGVNGTFRGERLEGFFNREFESDDHPGPFNLRLFDVTFEGKDRIVIRPMNDEQVLEERQPERRPPDEAGPRNDAVPRSEVRSTPAVPVRMSAATKFGERLSKLRLEDLTVKAGVILDARELAQMGPADFEEAFTELLILVQRNKAFNVYVDHWDRYALTHHQNPWLKAFMAETRVRQLRHRDQLKGKAILMQWSLFDQASPGEKIVLDIQEKLQTEQWILPVQGKAGTVTTFLKAAQSALQSASEIKAYFEASVLNRIAIQADGRWQVREDFMTVIRSELRAAYAVAVAA